MGVILLTRTNLSSGLGLWLMQVAQRLARFRKLTIIGLNVRRASCLTQWKESLHDMYFCNPISHWLTYIYIYIYIGLNWLVCTVLKSETCCQGLMRRRSGVYPGVPFIFYLKFTLSEHQCLWVFSLETQWWRTKGRDNRPFPISLVPLF